MVTARLLPTLMTLRSIGIMLQSYYIIITGGLCQALNRCWWEVPDPTAVLAPAPVALYDPVVRPGRAFRALPAPGLVVFAVSKRHSVDSSLSGRAGSHVTTPKNLSMSVIVAVVILEGSLYIPRFPYLL